MKFSQELSSPSSPLSTFSSLRKLSTVSALTTGAPCYRTSTGTSVPEQLVARKLLSVVQYAIKKEASSPNRSLEIATLEIASALEIGSPGNKACINKTTASGSTRSIAFEFAFESHMQENVASMDQQYNASSSDIGVAIFFSTCLF